MTTAALHAQRRDRTDGAVATVVLHVLLLLLFLFVALTEYDPPIPEETEEVAMADFGTDLAGSGNVETPDPGDQSQSAAAASSEEQPEEHDLNALVQETQEPFAARGQVIETVLGPVPPFTFRRNAMRRALNNLMDNAVRYGKSGVRVDTRR